MAYDRVMHSWMKSVWEKSHHLQVETDIADLPVHLPRERDSWLMQEFVRINCNCDDLRRLNRIRAHQEVPFLLDVMDASSRTIDRTYLEPRPIGDV